MGRLLYSVIGSLDGYVNDADGSYEWAVPGEDLIAWLNDEMASVGTYLCGRRMYEQMQVWETDPDFQPDAIASASPASAQFSQMWQAAHKVVFSSSMTQADVVTRRTHLEHAFDPERVRELVETAAGDVTVEGPTLAATALREGLVDEIHRFVVPVIVGGGTPLFPPDVRIELDLIEQRSFDRDIALQRYRVRSR